MDCGGNDNGQPSEITIIGNLFYDCDQAVTGKEQNFYVLLNNTVVHQTHQGGLDNDGAVVNLADEGKAEGAGMYLEGNIIYDVEKLVRNLTTATVTFNNNLTSLAWNGPGTDNSAADPLLNHIPSLAETDFKTWEEAQVLRRWFGLQPGSPALGRSPGRQDLGGAIPSGSFVSGVPPGTTRSDAATLTIEPNRTGQGITVAGWPHGAGYTHYKWRLDGGAWSSETPASTAVQLTGLTAGSHSIEVTGRRDSGLYQDDPLFGDDASVTAPPAWTVDPNYVSPPLPGLLLSEVLARNFSIFTSGETTPDLVELVNAGAVPLNLAGVGLSDDSSQPYKYRFPLGTLLDPGAYLVVLADSDTASPGIHLGFALKQEGDSLFLQDAPERGGTQLDQLTFGLQVADLSLGRRADGSWGLCRPTFGETNLAVSTGDPHSLRINEWLANARFLSADDFIELYNPEPRPVALSGLYLSDAAGAPDRYQIPPLSFIAAAGCLSLRADGDDQGRPGHVSFRLAAETGIIELSDADLTPIDVINYGPQATDVSQGRTPSGAEQFSFFRQPTPGALNPGSGGGGTTNIIYHSTPLLAFGATWRYLADLPDPGTSWRNTDFNDSTWKSGAGPLGLETSTPYPYPLPVKTTLPITAPNGTHIKTYYFRTHFQSDAPAVGLTLYATNYLDDGAVYYLNGVRVGALRVSDNPARHDSDATLQPDEGQMEVVPLAADHLRFGDNVLAVEVHQSGNSSSDVMFGLALAAVQAITNSTAESSQPLVLNEVFARNRSRPNIDGRICGWVELFNPNTNAVSLADLSLSDDSAVPRKWVFPEGSLIASGGFQTVWFDETRPISSTNTGFNLPNQGGAVFLSQRPADGGGVLDALHFGWPATDFAVGRVPDGGDDWVLTVPGENAVNVVAGLGSPTALRLNEWMADPLSGSDWFEIYNGDAAPVALHGLAVTDDLGSPVKSPFPPLSFIGTGRYAYVQMLADKKPASGANHADFKLAKEGSALGLFALSGLSLDALGFGAQTHGVSEGRLPDGADTFTQFPTSPTPEAPNRLAGDPGDADSDGMPDTWEDAHGLNRLVDDAALDPDGDGYANLDEYQAGTDPQQAISNLNLQANPTPDGKIELVFQGVAGHNYTAQIRDDLSGVGWQTLLQIPTRVGGGPVIVPAGTGLGAGHFYRIVTPAIP
ncbi:MAG TPA: hypothetical protein DCE44_15335 [Verrucomicrobiales bacterium]|nr:hypothetical protein [Verrucomicrobiales bacterium]